MNEENYGEEDCDKIAEPFASNKKKKTTDPSVYCNDKDCCEGKSSVYGKFHTGALNTKSTYPKQYADGEVGNYMCFEVDEEVFRWTQRYQNLKIAYDNSKFNLEQLANHTDQYISELAKLLCEKIEHLEQRIIKLEKYNL